MGADLAIAAGYAIAIAVVAFVVVQARERRSRRARRQLTEVRRILHHGLALPRVSMMAVDRAGMVTWFAGADVRRLGFSSPGLLGRHVRDVFSAWPECLHVIAGALRGERGAATIRLESAAFEVTCAPIYNDEGRLAAAVIAVRDETEARAAVERAERLSQIRSTAIATINHKIRGHLNGILGMSGLLRVTALRPQQREWVELSSTSGEQLLTFADHLVRFLELEATNPDLVHEPFSLRELVDDVASRHRAQAEADGTTFLVRYPLTTPEHFAGDADGLRRLIDLITGLALSTNAGGQVIVNVEQRDLTSETATLEVAVEDRGRGLDPDALRRVFDGLESPTAMWASRSEVTGLELPVARQLARAMGGDVVVESARGAGTAVRARLTLARAAAGGHALEDRRAAPDDQGPLQLLLVDDSRVQQRIALHLLSRLGHRVTPVPSGAEALSALEHRRFDAVLTELHMPDVDGFALVSAIRGGETRAADGRHLPVIALTSDTRLAIRERAREAGFDGFVDKPVDIDVLRDRLRSILQPPSCATEDDDRAPYDRSRLGHLRDDDRELVDELVETVLRVTPRQLVEVRDAAAALDTAALAPILDCVTESAHMLGAEQMRQRCGELAAAVSGGDLLASLRAADNLDAAFSIVRDALAADAQARSHNDDAA